MLMNQTACLSFLLLVSRVCCAAGTTTVPLNECGGGANGNAHFQKFWDSLSHDQQNACKWHSDGPVCERTDGAPTVVGPDDTILNHSSRICDSCDDRCSDGNSKTNPSERRCRHKVTTTVDAGLSTKTTGAIKGTALLTLEASLEHAVGREWTFGCQVEDFTEVTLPPCKWERSTLSVEYETGKGMRIEGSYSLSQTVEQGNQVAGLKCDIAGHTESYTCSTFSIEKTGNVCVSEGSLGADGGGVCDKTHPSPPRK